MSKTWKWLAEAVGIETEAGVNWQKLNRQKNMQRYGSQSGRAPSDPTALLRQRNAAAAANMPPDMTPKPGGLQIPGGTDRPGQGNPLMAPPRRPMVSRPEETDEADEMNLMNMIMGGDEED